MGIHDWWVNPQTSTADDPFRDMDQLYAPLGYRRLPHLDLTLVPGHEKVVLYATLNPDWTVKTVTHAARQEPDGTFTSKLGQLPLIRHRTAEGLRGQSYGLPVAVYTRAGAAGDARRATGTAQ
jgi:type VI secretion system secreted protein VgrG